MKIDPLKIIEVVKGLAAIGIGVALTSGVKPEVIGPVLIAIRDAAAELGHSIEQP